MPIAFDPPAHAPHGTLPTRGARSVDDDPAALDIFTQLLLAAATVQDAGVPLEPTSDSAHADAQAVDPSTLGVPLTLALPVPLASTGTPPPVAVTIVASEKVADVRPVLAADARAVLAGTVRAGLPEAATTTTDRSGASTAGGSAARVAATPGRDATIAPPPTLPPAATATPPPAPLTIRDAAPARAAAPAQDAAATLVALLTPATQAVDKASAAKPANDLATVPAQALAAAAPVSAPPVHVETIAAPAFTSGWQDETVSKLAQIVLTRTERAELRLHPAELGPVNVRIEMRADQASVQIVAASAETRSALEQSLPQLRDLLATQGITLGQATVHDGSTQRDARPDAWVSNARASESGGNVNAPAADTVRMVVRRSDRLVDVFA